MRIASPAITHPCFYGVDMSTYDELMGAMSVCGNVGGNQLQTSVLPFILRGVSLLGVDSVAQPLSQKAAIWQKLATEWRVADELVVDEVSLAEVQDVLRKLKDGQHLGRTIVALA